MTRPTATTVAVVVLMTIITLALANPNEWVRDTIEGWQGHSRNGGGQIHYLTVQSLEQSVVEQRHCTLIFVGASWNAHVKQFVKTNVWPSVADFFQHSRDVRVAALLGEMTPDLTLETYFGGNYFSQVGLFLPNHHKGDRVVPYNGPLSRDVATYIKFVEDTCIPHLSGHHDDEL